MIVKFYCPHCGGEIEIYIPDKEVRRKKEVEE